MELLEILTAEKLATVAGSENCDELYNLASSGSSAINAGTAMYGNDGYGESNGTATAPTAATAIGEITEGEIAGT